MRVRTVTPGGVMEPSLRESLAFDPNSAEPPFLKPAVEELAKADA